MDRVELLHMSQQIVVHSFDAAAEKACYASAGQLTSVTPMTLKDGRGQKCIGYCNNLYNNQ